MTTKTYKVTYQAPSGKYCSFKFQSDKSFRSYSKHYSGGIFDLGYPFTCDLMAKAEEISQRPDSAMVREGGFDWTKIKKITCFETAEIKYFG